MPIAAAIPAIIAGVGAAGSIGSAISSGGKPAAGTIPVAPPAPVMPGLNQTYQAIASQGLTTGTTTLENAAGGQDIAGMFQTIVDASKRQTAEGTSAIQNAYGKSGMAQSTDMGRTESDFQLQTQKDLMAQLSTMLLENQRNQIAAGGALQSEYGAGATTYAPTQAVVGLNQSPWQMASSGIQGSLMSMILLQDIMKSTIP